MSLYIRSVLLCDDVRFEVTGKEIVIGLYAGGLFVPQFPTAPTRFIIRVECFFAGKVVSSLQLRFDTPSGRRLFEGEKHIQFFDWNAPGSVLFSTDDIVFDEPGDHPISTRILGGEWEQATVIIVKAPISLMPLDHIKLAIKQLQEMEEAQSSSDNAPPTPG